jgi:hypothetical protein
MAHNNNCDGSHCRSEAGEVRLYPLGGGANLILCHACWAHENRYRYERAHERNAEPANWPQVNWHAAKIYENAGG